VAQEIDNTYKTLFSYPRMVSDLLTGFVREDWVRELDLSTLEKVNASYVADEVRERHDDLVWRVRWGEEWLYVYLLLEFQSTVDPYMAVRMPAYVSLLYQDLIRQEKLTESGSLPPVLPVVLYNGDRDGRRRRRSMSSSSGFRGGWSSIGCRCSICCLMRVESWSRRRPRISRTWSTRCSGWSIVGMSRIYSTCSPRWWSG